MLIVLSEVMTLLMTIRIRNTTLACYITLSDRTKSLNNCNRSSG